MSDTTTGDPAAGPATGPAEGAVPLVEVTRRDVRTGSQVVESVHHGHLVEVDADGTAHAVRGLADVGVFPRSAVKPLQATICLELLATADPALAASLTDDEVAVAWASHRAEPEQLASVRRLLARGGLDEDALTCPRAGVPDDPAAPRSRLAHNCSGKHALFVLTAHVLGLATDAATVLDPDGPMQAHVLDALTGWTGPARAVGVDGCGAPAVVVPLDGLARAFARLAVEERTARARDAGLARPLMVGGSERRSGGTRVPLVDSALLAAGVVAKRGAEGVLAAGWRAGDGTGRGVAVKALDGSLRGAATALVAHLEAAGVVAPGTWVEAVPLGGGEVAGEVRAATPAGATGGDAGAVTGAVT